MKKLKQLSFLFSIIFSTTSFAKNGTELSSKVSLFLGSSSHSFTQIESAFPDDDVASGSSSILLMLLGYERFYQSNRSIFLNFSFSGVGGEVEKHYMGSAGVKYYFSEVGTKLVLKDNNFSINTAPKLAYYAGWEVGGMNAVYQANESVRSDLAIAYGGVAGLSYASNDQMMYTGEIHILKGNGVETEFLDFQVFFGLTYMIDPLF